MFVVPSWAAAHHHSPSGADLFELADTPVLRALGLYREEPARDELARDEPHRQEPQREVS